MKTLNDTSISSKMIAVSLFIAIITIILASICIMAQPVLADVGDDVALGITQVTTTLKKVVNPIGITAVVCCGIYMLFGSDPATLKKIKGWLLSIVGGLLLINLAEPLINWARTIGA